MSDQKYVRLCKSFYDKGILIKAEDLHDNVISDKEFYASTYYYNQKQYEEFQKSKSVKGVRDVKTNILWWDFDNENDPELSRHDAVELVNRLKKLNVKEKDIEVYFSGNKGYNVVITLTKELTPDRVGKLCLNIGKGLKTLDNSLYDATQILRVPGTTHNKSGLFKIPLTVKQLRHSDTNAIKKLASSLDNVQDEFQWDATDIDESQIVEEKTKETPKVTTKLSELLAKKPKDWKDYKWALLNAYMVKPDERHESLMRIAATCRGLGYPQEMAKIFCQTFDEKFCAETKKEPVEDLETNILPSIYSELWNGGQYSYKNDVFLQSYVERIGLKPEDEIKGQRVKSIGDIYKDFEHFSANFEKNILKTGIKELDENVLFLTSTHNGLLGNPGSGKTSLVLQWMKYLSGLGLQSFFYSLDMAEETIFAKLVQSVTGYEFEKAVKLLKEDPNEFERVFNKIKEEYKHVEFIFTSGTTPENIRDDIKSFEESSGKKVRLLVVDYLECLQGPYSDATANTGFLSQQMKDVARETKVCSVMLLQTQKHSIAGGDVSEPLLSMKQIKGSSAIEQSSSVILTIWREGYNPKFQSHDNFLSCASVKNRFGKLWTADFEWEGSKGYIDSMTDEGREKLAELRELKLQAKMKAAEEDKGWS